MVIRPTLVKHIPLVIKMIKKSILLSLLLIAGVFFIIDFNTKPNALRCEIELFDEIENVNLNVRLNFIFNLDGNKDGLVSMIGFITRDKQRYRLDRILNFTYRAYDNNNTNEYKFHNKHINPNDTTPKELSAILFKTVEEGGTYYGRLSKVTNEIYLIQNTAKPLWFCHKY